MIEKNKCPSCKHIYEVSWDDDDSEYYEDNETWDDDQSYEDELYPEYCPFCGIHREYGGECDSYDDAYDDK